MLRDTRYEIDLDAVAHNYRQVVRMLELQPPNLSGQRPQVAAVLKADGYGLGAVHMAAVLLESGADMLAVACLPEALELRRHYDNARILIMGHTPDRLLADAVRRNISCTIFDPRQARLLSAAAIDQSRLAVAHIKVDTGMNRLGLKPDATSPQLLADMAALPGLDLEGIFTHLALCDRTTDYAQFDMFMWLVSAAGQHGVHFRLRHVCDSIGLMRYPEFRLDMVRAGAVLYGVTPMNTPLSGTADIRVPFALRSRISRLRRLTAGEGVGYDHTWKAPAAGALVATLPIGYADGYRRCMGNRAFAMVHGVRAPVVGLVCMDQCNLDVSAVPGVVEGDDVLLLGTSQYRNPDSVSNGGIAVLEMAEWAATNRNEIISAIGRRVPRHYYRHGRLVDTIDYLAVDGGR
jgi:alanine racemase